MVKLLDKKYAVVKLAGKQYRVSEGQTVLVDRMTNTKKIEYSTLLFVDNDKVKVGKPVLTDVKVAFEVVSETEKGEKIRIFKYKSKSRYRKRMGFRAQMTKLLVKKIS